MKLCSQGGRRLPFVFQASIELDSNFAIAYAWLGRAYRDLDENATAADYTRKAYELRGSASEAEKYFILASLRYRSHGKFSEGRTNLRALDTDLSAQSNTA